MKAPELILDILEEQNSFAFSGKVTGTEKLSESETFSLWFKEGQLIEVRTQKRSGLKALYEVFFQEFLGVRFNYKLQEEDATIAQSIYFPLAQIKIFLNAIVDDLEDHDEFRPDKQLELIIKSGFVKSGPEITELEYNVLELVAKYASVADIYEKTDLLGFEVSKALVSLKRKDAFKVIALN